MPEIKPKLRAMAGPLLHAKEYVQAKTTNRNKRRLSHLGHRIVNSRVIIAIRTKVDKFRRLIKSKRIFVRRITPLQAELLKAVDEGRGLDFGKLKTLDFNATDTTMEKWGTGLQNVLRSVPEVRKANQQEQQRISHLSEIKAREYREELAAFNGQTIGQDFLFVKENPRMARDICMHDLLYRGMPDKEGNRVTLAHHFKKCHAEHEHQMNLQKSRLTADLNQLKLQLQKEGVDDFTIQGHKRVIALEGQIDALHVQPAEVLKDAMQTYQPVIAHYQSMLDDQLKQRQQKADEGTSVLSPKPLLACQLASSQEAMKLVDRLTGEESVAARAEFAERYDSALGLSQGADALGDAMYRNVRRHVAKLRQQEGINKQQQFAAANNAQMGPYYYSPTPAKTLSSRAAASYPEPTTSFNSTTAGPLKTLSQILEEAWKLKQENPERFEQIKQRVVNDPNPTANMPRRSGENWHRFDHLDAALRKFKQEDPEKFAVIVRDFDSDDDAPINLNDDDLIDLNDADPAVSSETVKQTVSPYEQFNKETLSSADSVIQDLSEFTHSTQQSLQSKNSAKVTEDPNTPRTVPVDDLLGLDSEPLSPSGSPLPQQFQDTSGIQTNPMSSFPTDATAQPTSDYDGYGSFSPTPKNSWEQVQDSSGKANRMGSFPADATVQTMSTNSAPASVPRSSWDKVKPTEIWARAQIIQRNQPKLFKQIRDRVKKDKKPLQNIPQGQSEPERVEKLMRRLKAADAKVFNDMIAHLDKDKTWFYNSK